MTSRAEIIIRANLDRLDRALNETRNRIRNLGGSFGLAGAAMTAAAAAAAVAFVRTADEIKLVEARLKSVTNSVNDFEQANAAAFSMAQRLQAPYAEVASSIARLLPAVQELGGGVTEATKLSEILISTARLSGASTAEASASMLQFAQALGSGTLQGDELRSLLENNNTLARELASGLGVTIGELRDLGSESALTSELVSNTLLKKYDEIAAKTAELPVTVDGAFTRMSNSMGALFSAMDKGSGVTSALADIVTYLAEAVNAVAASFRSANTMQSEFGGNESALSLGSALKSVFETVVETVVGVIDAIRAMIILIKAGIDNFMALASAANQAVRGNFSGAADLLVGRAKDIGAEFQQVKELIMGSGSSSMAYLRQMQSFSGGAGGGRGSANDPRRLDAGSIADVQLEKPEPKQTKEQKAAAREAAKAQRDAGREARKEKEQYERAELARMREIQREYELQIANKRKITQIERESAAAAAIEQINRLQDQSQFELDQGLITKSQLLEQTRAHEQAVYEIRRQAMQANADAIDPQQDPVKKAQVDAELQELERQHQTNLMDIRRQVAAQASIDLKKEQDPANTVFGSLEQAFEQAATGIATKAGTLNDILKNMWRQMYTSFVQEYITKKIAAEAMAAIKTSAIGKMMLGQKIATDQAGAASGMAAKTAETTANVGMSAVEAAANAFKAMAGIPVIGPMLAVGAAAAAMSAVMGLLSGGGGGTSVTTTRIPSAAGGFDIPAGVNPLTQLHEQEMVLPKDIANPLREQVASGGAAGAISVTINAVDAQSVRRLFVDNPDELAAGIRKAVKMGLA